MDNYTFRMLDNDTAASDLTCEELQVEFGSPLPLPLNVATVLRYVQAVYYLIYFILGVLLNVFVTVLILRYKKLRNVTFILALQVCVGDMINSAIVFPTSAVNAVVGHYVFTGLCSNFRFYRFLPRYCKILPHVCASSRSFLHCFLALLVSTTQNKSSSPFLYWSVDVSIHSSPCPRKRPA